MKKVICVCLSLVLLLFCASCNFDARYGGGSGAAIDIFEAFNEQYTPTMITTAVDYVYINSDNDTENLPGYYVTKIDGNKTEMTYRYTRLAAIGESDNRFVTVEGKLYKDGDRICVEGDAWESAEAYGSDFTLSIKQENLAEFTVSEDGTTLTAKISPDKAEAIFGTAISTTGNITLTMTSNGTSVTGVDISYTTVSGASVTIRTTYTYSPVTVEIPA